MGTRFDKMGCTRGETINILVLIVVERKRKGLSGLKKKLGKIGKTKSRSQYMYRDLSKKKGSKRTK